jgi:hypothetical protein
MVGYGDFRPSRKTSRILAIVLAFVGIVFAGIVVAMAIHAADFAYAEVYIVSETRLSYSCSPVRGQGKKRPTVIKLSRASINQRLEGEK